jgi:hypothetical protein
MSEKTKSSNKPAYYAYTAEDRGDKTYWNRVGVAFRTKSDKGINVVLTSLPVNGKLTLLPPEEKAEPAPADQA